MKNRNMPRFVRFGAVAVVAFGGMLAAVGCDKTTTTTSTPAANGAASITGVVDLDKVADAVGWNAEINKDNETAKAELTRLVTSFATEVLDKVKQHKTDLAKTAKLSDKEKEDLYADKNLDKLPLTKEQLQTLAIVLQNRQQYIQGADQYAGQLLQKRRMEILQSYRKATQPIVRQVAEQAGMTIVLLKNDAIFHNAASVEITDKVTDAVRANTPKITYPSMPTMNLPTINLGEVAPTTTPSVPTPATRASK